MRVTKRRRRKERGEEEKEEEGDIIVWEKGENVICVEEEGVTRGVVCVYSGTNGWQRLGH